MSAGAANLVDHVLPDVAIRQFVVTMPFPRLRPAKTTSSNSSSQGTPGREK
jgi:hypothetical protein